MNSLINRYASVTLDNGLILIGAIIRCSEEGIHITGGAVKQPIPWSRVKRLLIDDSICLSCGRE